VTAEAQMTRGQLQPSIRHQYQREAALHDDDHPAGRTDPRLRVWRQGVWSSGCQNPLM
jgi:hypothetical protein